MLLIRCDNCKTEVINKEKIIEIGSDNHSLYMNFPGGVGLSRYHNLHFCGKTCFFEFLNIDLKAGIVSGDKE